MDPKYAEPNDTHVDASDIKVVAATREQVSEFSKTRDGFEDAVKCFLRLSPAMLERIGINPTLATKATDFMATDKRCHEILPAAKKLPELLHETSLHARHELAGIITQVSRQARFRAERDPNGDELLAELQELLEYQNGPAKKAAATREKAKKKESEKAAQQQAAQQSAQQTAQQPEQQPEQQDGNP